VASKRVSLKGKGADIFFGDYQPPPAEPATAEPLPHGPAAPPPAATTDDQDVAMQERTHARKQARLPARMHASKQAAEHEPSTTAQPIAAEALAAALAHVGERATVTNAFRYTDRELAWLTDVLYELSKRHQVKLSKQDVARFGLDLVMADYQARADASLLSEFARRRKRQGVKA
jgi:hypothetical protein